jgi:hypothetical protein
MTRGLLLVIALIGLISVWLDPFTYTMHPAGPQLSPLWWKVAALADTALLLWFGWNVIVANWWRAYIAIGVAVMLSLVGNAIYVRIRGIDRFLIIFQTDEILYLYLFVVALRVVALFVCGIVLVKEGGSSSVG